MLHIVALTCDKFIYDVLPVASFLRLFVSVVAVPRLTVQKQASFAKYVKNSVYDLGHLHNMSALLEIPCGIRLTVLRGLPIALHVSEIHAP